VDFILAIAREKLGRLKLEEATVALQLGAEALLPYVPRSSSWLPGRQELAVGRERLVERLCARLGPQRVFGIALGNDHRPEYGWGKRDQVAFSETGKSNPSPFSSGPRPAWLLQRSRRLVNCDDPLPGPLPREREAKPQLQGPLTFISGPERIEAGWWDGEPVNRDYFVAANPAGETCWIYREHRDPLAWYLHGVFA
jgi:protein ImuB